MSDNIQTLIPSFTGQTEDPDDVDMDFVETLTSSETKNPTVSNENSRSFLEDNNDENANIIGGECRKSMAVLNSESLSSFIDCDLTQHPLYPLNDDPEYRRNKTQGGVQLKRIPTPKDGNCYMACLSYHLHGHFGECNTIRKIIYDHVCRECFLCDLQELCTLAIDSVQVTFKSQAYLKQSLAYKLARQWQLDTGQTKLKFLSGKFVEEFILYLFSQSKPKTWTDYHFTSLVVADIYRTVVVPHIVDCAQHQIKRLSPIRCNIVADETPSYFYFIFYNSHFDVLTITSSVNVIIPLTTAPPVPTIINRGASRNHFIRIPGLKRRKHAAVYGDLYNEFDNVIYSSPNGTNVLHGFNQLPATPNSASSSPVKLYEELSFFTETISDEYGSSFLDDDIEEKNSEVGSVSSSSSSSKMISAETATSTTTKHQRFFDLYCSRISDGQESYVGKIISINHKKRKVNSQKQIDDGDNNDGDNISQTQKDQLECFTINLGENFSPKTHWETMIFHVHLSSKLDASVYTVKEETKQLHLLGLKVKGTFEALNFMIPKNLLSNATIYLLLTSQIGKAGKMISNML